ncbi:hypothetical protein [Lacipirellula sp.]|uniref:hypothetical protein n=1 Tax=Lacipirellula sp. TaxID=2691419 RepID=UPI003D1116A9
MPALVEGIATVGREVTLAYLSGGASIYARGLRAVLVVREGHEAYGNARKTAEAYADGDAWGVVFNGGMTALNLIGVKRG